MLFTFLLQDLWVHLVGITIIINLGVTLCYFKLWLMTINSSLICLWGFVGV
jgi:hypothetical protein